MWRIIAQIVLFVVAQTFSVQCDTDKTSLLQSWTISDMTHDEGPLVTFICQALILSPNPHNNLSRPRGRLVLELEHNKNQVSHKPTSAVPKVLNIDIYGSQ